MHVGASMAANNSNNQLGGLGDYLLDQILVNPSTYVSGDATAEFGVDGSFGLGSMALQLGTGPAQRNGMGIGMPLGLNLEHGGFFRPGIDDGLSNDSSPSSIAQVINERDAVYLPSFYPAYGQLQPHAVQLVESSQPHHPQLFHSQQPRVTTPNPPAVRHRIRARRGQATDPHSIAERVRRERITDRVKALQELVPSVNKTDRATMVDEIVDYVKFLRLQVQVLSMSRLGGTGSVVQLASDVPLSSAEGASTETITSQPAWEKWSADGAEYQVAELMEKDVGAAMQFLQSKALCIMPLSLASSIFHTTNSSILLKSESNAGY